MILLENILKVGGIGCLLFTAYLLLMAYGGVAAAMRDEDGNFKKERNWKTVLGGVTSLLFFLGGLYYWGNQYYIAASLSTPSFFSLWLNAFGIFMVIHLYDLIVTDYLVVVKWHPKFLNLPDTDYYTIMSPHIEGFFKGLPLGMVVNLLVALFCFYV
ncbi:MAG: hypothetical protein AAF960_04125 [Bacteroidota bacterium]